MNKSEKFWNKLSGDYDKKAKDKTFIQILERSKKYLKSKDTVLDFACATGLYSLEFAKYVKEIQAFDTSSKMIAIAKDNRIKTKNKNIVFAQTNLFDEEYREGSFDVILAFNILLYFNDVEKVMNRMKKLLKPNGILITSTACLKEKRTFAAILSGVVIFVLKKLRVLPYLKFLRIKELKDTITNSGFEILESDVLIEKPAVEYYIVGKKKID